jgi:hypothetical protein
VQAKTCTLFFALSFSFIPSAPNFSYDEAGKFSPHNQFAIDFSATLVPSASLPASYDRKCRQEP